MRPGTLPKLFRAQVQDLGSRVALREKELGVWNEITWEKYYEHVRDVSLGLVKIGLDKGDKVSILSENNQQWLYGDLAIQSVRALTVGVYSTNPSEQVKYVVGHSESRFIIVEDQEQADKVLEVAEDLPHLEKIIVIDMKGLRHYESPLLMSFQELEEMGAAYHEEHPQHFEKMIDSTDPSDLAVIIYTSGTTGPPKGALLTQQNMMAMIDSVLQVMPMTEKDAVVSYLPLCHAAERIFSILIPIKSGCIVNFAESINTVQEALREIGPTLFMGVPRIWEKMQSSIVIKIQDATFLKRLVYKVFMPVGVMITEKRLAKERVGLPRELLYWVAYFSLYRSLRHFLGLSRARITISGAAPVSPDLLKFFHAMRINIREGYGQTEISGICCIHHFDDVKIGTVGKPVPGVELKIAEDGEILEKGPGIFEGYFKDPKGTAAVFSEGWLCSGDVGRLDEDGHLVITDRKKDILVTAGGKNIAPSEQENSLKFSPYINEAIVIGDGRKFLSALIQIEFENVSKWAQKNKIPFTTFKSLARDRRVYELIQKEVDVSNGKFASVEHIRKFVLLEKELDHDDEELTATMKVRRKAIEEKYRDLIESIYGKGRS
ncbi:MAG: AMP-binding protein [Deltaproteobacteria bacterium]|nr:AMP-binding protein [Deltaproteobacteria bacterium]MBW1941965.1 AMP-binding protein [Deltaproteobacteria bacterium]